MSPRLLLPLLLAAAAAGYAAAVFLTPRWVDRHAPTPDADAAAPSARAELEALGAVRDPEERARLRAAFLARFPESWLRARWARERGP